MKAAIAGWLSSMILLFLLLLAFFLYVLVSSDKAANDFSSFVLGDLMLLLVPFEVVDAVRFLLEGLPFDLLLPFALLDWTWKELSPLGYRHFNME